jgi:hypothetical protein
VDDLNAFEDNLIEQFRQHPVLANLDTLSDDGFAGVLLQRRFISLAFTPAYDLAIDLLRDNVVVRIARLILREEYPDSRGYTPSHREDMRDDMFALGITRQEFVHTRPTPETLDTITATMSLIADAGAHEHADLRLLTILRFWGEVLVSVEYGQMWRRMEPRLVVDGVSRSRFYYPHHIHDAKAHPLASTSPLASTHSDRLGIRLSEMLTSAEHRASFMEVEEQILSLKTRFLDQFQPLLRYAHSG